MKTTLLTLGSALLLLQSCAPLGLYRPKDLINEARIARARGIDEGRATELRRQELIRELELTKPQSSSEYYELPIPAYTNTDGVQIAPHTSIQKFHIK